MCINNIIGYDNDDLTIDITIVLASLRLFILCFVT